MKWFRKSLPAPHANPHNQTEQKCTQSLTKQTIMKSRSFQNLSDPEAKNNASKLKVISKSLSVLDNQRIEIIDPEIFFQDPEHVRNYKEEAQFLSIMSEWEIIENPSLVGNYFSADFEEEFLQMKIQQDSNSATVGLSIVATATAVHQSGNNASNACLDNSETTKCRKRSYKRSLSEILFAVKIETGLVPPMAVNELNMSSPTLNKKRRRLKVDSSDEDVSLCMTTTTTTTTAASTFNQQIIKDCSIDRSQLKTEALARSIMGAIGKCPDRDKTPPNSMRNIDDIKHLSTDVCHPVPGSCDHYDIKQFFRLDDYGNICLNITHVEESRGFGFTVSHNKIAYKRYLKESLPAEEKPTCHRRRYCVEILKNMLKVLWNIIKCHPRNKINIYSGGPGESLRAYTLQLAQDQYTTFARNIENFIACTKDSREAAPQVVMRNMRQFMNGMKNYLVKHGEGKFHQEVEAARSRLKSDEFLNLDAILETVMHQLVVLPLREHLYGMFVDYYTRSEDIQLLAQNVKYACGRNAADFGIRPSVSPPSPSSLQAISNLLLRLQEAELPLEKLDLFLCVISTIFEATGCPRGQQLGADDFLPVLVYVVAKCGFVGAEIEAEFMWGLLQPTLLNGEPGYYLTALCSAVHVLKSFMASENESGSGSLDWRSSSLPACSSVLRVIIPDECNGSLQTRTLPVRPHTTTREVCRIIAHKARITNPQDYGLFKLVDGEETILNDNECPQDIRLAAKGKHCMLAYKRIDAKIAWPTATQPISN
ncbi:src homology 2 domain-containing protein sprint isoform 6-T14 [Glossina fuscipes fuscipes]